MSKLSPRTLFFLWAFGSILLLAVFGLLVFFAFYRPSAAPVSVPSGTTPSPEITQIIPAEGIILQPAESATLPAGRMQQFTLTFSHAITPSDYTVSLMQQDLGGSDKKQVAVTSSYNPSTTILTISAQTETLPYSLYQLDVVDTAHQHTIVSAHYVSGGISPTPVQKNNLELRQYLPYETSTYRLSYNQSRNIYVFNFKINPSSSDGLETQYEAAKAQAIQFIKSKGIDLQSVTVEWRHS